MARGTLEIVGDDDLGLTDPGSLVGDGDNRDGGNGGPGNGDNFDASIHIGRDRINADGSFRRKRVKGGRSASGGTTRPRKASTSLDITGVQAVLYSTHAAIAGATGSAVWALSDGEAKSLAQAIIELERQYPTQIDPRALAWINLFGVAGAIYGTRLFAMRMEGMARRAARPERSAPAPQSAPPPSATPGPHPADVNSPAGVREAGTQYQRVPDGIMDTDALAAAMRSQGVNVPPIR